MEKTNLVTLTSKNYSFALARRANKLEQITTLKDRDGNISELFLNTILNKSK